MSKIKQLKEKVENAIGKEPETDSEGFSLCTICDHHLFSSLGYTSLSYRIMRCKKCRADTMLDGEGIIQEINL